MTERIGFAGRGPAVSVAAVATRSFNAVTGAGALDCSAARLCLLERTRR